MSEQAQDYLSFRVGQQWYGVDVRRVIEVLHLVALTELPAAPPDVLGLMVARDVVMPVIDLRRRFGLATAPLRLDTPIIALQAGRTSPAQAAAAGNGSGAAAIGLVVDEVDDVTHVTTQQFSAYDDAASPYVSHVARLPERLLLVLDTLRLRQETALPASANGAGGREDGASDAA